MTSHPLGLAHRGPGGMCLDTTQHPICLGIGAPHDVIAWYHLTLFCRPMSRVGHQMGEVLMDLA
jgi:hypothetical protein